MYQIDSQNFHRRMAMMDSVRDRVVDGLALIGEFLFVLQIFKV